MLCMNGFATANIYHLQQQIFTTNMKIHNYKLENTQKKLDPGVSYSGFLNTIKIDVHVYQISFECDIKIRPFAVLLKPCLF